MVSVDEDSSSGGIQDSDYDGAWKEALRSHLPIFLEKCFPDLFNLIDWTRDLVWLDKEISQVVGQSGHRNRAVDLLFKVWLLDGNEQWIYCHLEIQTSFETKFEFRIDLYNSGLKWMFRRHVLTLVILADLNPQWRPSESHFELGGFQSSLKFPICKLLDHLETDWAEDRSLTVQLARAQIAALRTANDPEARYHAKTQIVRNLYTSGYNAGEIRELYRLIDWMMHLRLDLSRRFEAELTSYEKEMKMPYVTSIERHAEERGLEKGLEKGREEGRVQGTTAILLRLLTRRCGELPESIQQDVRQLSLQQSQDLGDALLDFRTQADLANWLRIHGR